MMSKCYLMENRWSGSSSCKKSQLRNQHVDDREDEEERRTEEKRSKEITTVELTARTQTRGTIAKETENCLFGK